MFSFPYFFPLPGMTCEGWGCSSYLGPWEAIEKKSHVLQIHKLETIWIPDTRENHPIPELSTSEFLECGKNQPTFLSQCYFRAFLLLGVQPILRVVGWGDSFVPQPLTLYPKARVSWDTTFGGWQSSPTMPSTIKPLTPTPISSPLSKQIFCQAKI